MKIFIPLCVLGLAALCQARSLQKRQTSGEEVFSCSFDGSPPLCDGTQYADLPWIVWSGPTPTECTGPPFARDGANYLYMEADYAHSWNYTAIYVLPDIFSPADYCVQFSYNMWGFLVGIFRLIQISTDSSRSTSSMDTVWLRAGQQTAFWIDEKVTVNLKQNYKIGFLAIAGWSHISDIAIDRVIVTAGACDSPPTTTTLPTPTPKNIAEGRIFECDFEDEDLCNMAQSSQDVFDWTRNTGRTKSQETGPNGAYMGSYYMYIEASSPRKNGDDALIFLPSLNHVGDACLKFAYSMYGFHVSELQVWKKERGVNQVLWSEQGDKKRSTWHKKELDVKLAQGDQLGFWADVGTGYSGDIAVDSVEVYSHSCSNEAGQTTTKAPRTTTTKRSPTTTTTTTRSPATTTTTTRSPATTTTTTRSPTTTTTTTTTTRSPTTTTTSSSQTTTTAKWENPEPTFNWVCNFENNGGNRDDCGIQQETAIDEFDWTIHSGKTPSDLTGPSSAHSGQYYAFIEATGRNKGDKAIMRLPAMNRVGRACLQFEYHMYGHHINTLEIGVFHYPEMRAYNSMFQIQGEQGDQWKHAQIMVDLTHNKDQIAIVGVRGSEYAGDIAVDSLKILSATCQTTLPFDP